MEVLQETVTASCTPARSFKALLVNFKKLQAADTPPSKSAKEFAWQDMLHAVAGLCSVALPDMEEAAIYSSLTRSGSKTVVLTTPTNTTTTPEHQQQQTSHHHQIRALTAPAAESVPSHGVSSGATDDTDTYTPSNAPGTTEAAAVVPSSSEPPSTEPPSTEPPSSMEFENPFQEFFSASDTSDAESVAEDEFSEGRKRFLEACRERHRHQRQSLAGLEERVAGCGCFMRLSDRPGGSAVQVQLLAVRHRWRRAGLGSFLLQTMKDPAVVGSYDALLTFADHKAERFFATHGFSHDPILTAKYSGMVDHWENSSLMAYLPPFSMVGVTSTVTGSAGSLSFCEDSFVSWRESAIASYCEQLSLMQRLRHEMVLLHSKLQSCKIEIKTLNEELEQARRDKLSTDLEFSNYRKHTQKLLCEARVDKAKEWMDSVQYAS